MEVAHALGKAESQVSSGDFLVGLTAPSLHSAYLVSLLLFPMGFLGSTFISVFLVTSSCTWPQLPLVVSLPLSGSS